MTDDMSDQTDYTVGDNVIALDCPTCDGDVLLPGQFGTDPLGLKVCPDCLGGRGYWLIQTPCHICDHLDHEGVGVMSWDGGYVTCDECGGANWLPSPVDGPIEVTLKAGGRFTPRTEYHSFTLTDDVQPIPGGDKRRARLDVTT